MFNLSRQVDYTFQFLIALAALKSGEYLSLREFSQESNISFLFLQRIAGGLKAHNVIGSLRGAHDGYFLKIRPDKITLRKVIEIADGPSGVTDCLKPDGKCANIKTCTARKVFKHINRFYLNSISNHYLHEFI